MRLLRLAAFGAEQPGEWPLSGPNHPLSFDLCASIRDLPRLRKAYGAGRWRKLKGIAMVRLPDDTICKAEIHWYEAHGIGKKDIKIKHILD